MAVSKKRKPNKKKLKVVSRKGSIPSKLERDIFKNFKVKIEDLFYDKVLEVIDLGVEKAEELFETDKLLEELDDFYAAKSINSYANQVTDFIRNFSDKIPQMVLYASNDGVRPIIDVVGRKKFMRVVHKLDLTAESLLDDAFSDVARKYARVIMDRNILHGNASKAAGLGATLMDRYLLEVDARRALESGISPNIKLCSNTSLVLQFFMNPDEFSDNPQSYLSDVMESISESMEYWNVTKEEVEKYKSKELTSTDIHKLLHPEDFIEPTDLEEEPEVKLEEEPIVKPKYNYIGDWRELSSLAEEQGFTKIRQKGDHGVFRHGKGLTVIIPQGRPIGRGLSYEIQKALFAEDKTGSAWYGVNFH